MAHSFHNTHSLNIYGLTTEEAYSKLDTEIAKTQTYLCSLRALRNSLPPVSHIPAEVLSTIFAYCQDDADPSVIDKMDTKTRFSVSWVCRSWRETALATPALWSIITAKNARHLSLMKLLIDRSRTSNLVVSVATSEREILASCLSVLPRILHFRWDTLAPLSMWTYEEPPELFSQAAPLLSSLELVNFRFLEDKDLFSATYPQLRSVTLQSCRMASLPQLMTPTLTCLRFIEVDYRDFTPHLLNILPSLETLEELVIEDCFVRSDPRGPVNLPCLRLLHLLGSECRSMFNFLKCLDVSQARIRVNLEWDEDDEDLEDRFQQDFLPAFENYLLEKDFPVRNLKINYLDEGESNLPLSLGYTVDISTDLLSNRYTIEFEPPDIEPADKITALVCSVIPTDNLENFASSLLPPDVLSWSGTLATLKTITLNSGLDLVGFLESFSTLNIDPKYRSDHELLFLSLEKLVLRDLDLDESLLGDLYTALELRRDAGLVLDHLEFLNCRNVDKERFVPVVKKGINVLPLVVISDTT
ncbi:hypothetical protein BDN72DRAFT_834552 [Pluteus cervinus]|uniref:Uncharacterized protein n=1 Tax=Pluteus cervinus TaxID=181527 RepID=A0ACD3B6G7_9AGAR|nr:hypothetical protein BDN72DRAFT_834552 [Pluteus cervinus]